MVLLCKQKALYVKCCVIANGVTDSQGDTLNAEDIKKIFTSFNNQNNFGVYHNGIPLQEVSLLENYITTTDETIGTAVVPRGSWNAVVRVDNPEIQDLLLNNTLRGVSLDNRIAEPCKNNLHGIIRYKDIQDMECVIPLYISFVEGGANGYGLQVMDYPAYIKKSKDIIIEDKGDAKNMAFDLLSGLKNLIKQAEEGDPTSVKEETPTQETKTNEQVVKKEDPKPEEKEEEEPKINKEDDCDFETKVTQIVEKILAKKEEEEGAKQKESSEPVDEKKEEDTPKITKSQKVVITNENITHTNYYEMTGRDPVTGKKLRN